VSSDAVPVYETNEPVLYDVRGKVAVITLNRPDYHNAQNVQLLYALDEAWSKACADENVGCILLRSNGRNFSAGHDIGSPGRDITGKIEAPRGLHGDHTTMSGAANQYVREQEAYLGLCQRWRGSAKPAVAAVQGACIAGGLMLAWVCDLIVAAEDASFSDPVLKMGIPGVEYFAHAFEMHPRVAREFLLLGDRMSAERAYALGMVNRVVASEQLEAEAFAIAERIADLPAFGVMLAKKAFNFQEDRMGKADTLNAVFHMHHIAHGQNLLLGKDSIGNVKVKDIKGSR
jgi:enoyl-CoA hydratase